jgi:Dehydrogenases with different specificities (related to short-chain alcohol dehydrogenases)
MDWTGKRVIVTGGANGIGAASVSLFRRGGARVAILDASEVEAEGSEVWSFTVDLADADAARAAALEAVSTLNGCDVLVNVVGVARPRPFTSLTDADFATTFDTNVRGTFICSQIAAQSMVAERSGAIVNVSSVAASLPGPEYVFYSASKGAVTSMTRAMAVDLAPHGIRVNAVAPGPIATAMGAKEIFGRGQEHTARQLDRILLGRIGKPEDVASVIEFLASDGAGFVTGQVVTVDGGVTVKR